MTRTPEHDPDAAWVAAAEAQRARVRHAQWCSFEYVSVKGAVCHCGAAQRAWEGHPVERRSPSPWRHLPRVLNTLFWVGGALVGLWMLKGAR